MLLRLNKVFAVGVLEDKAGRDASFLRVPPDEDAVRIPRSLLDQLKKLG
jgi:hypothetical protein